MQRKSQASGTLFLVLVLGLAGCGQTQMQPPPPPEFKDVALRIACPRDHQTASLLRAYALPWKRKQRADLKFIFVTRDQLGKEASEDAKDQVDIWVIRPADLPQLVQAGKLAPLPEKYIKARKDYQWRGLLPLYREHLLLWAGPPYGFPLQGESPLCCYRGDLFRKHERAFRMRYGRAPGPPRTWEEFTNLAEFFHQHASDQEKPSLPALPEDDESLVRLFYTVASCYALRAVPFTEELKQEEKFARAFSFQYDLSTGEPRIASPGFVHALKLLQQWQKYRPGSQKHPKHAFRTGQAVLCITNAPHVATFQKPTEVRDRVFALSNTLVSPLHGRPWDAVGLATMINPLRDHFGICAIPGARFYFDPVTGAKRQKPNENNRVPYLGAGGWLGVVSARSLNKDAAFELLAHLSSPEISQQIASEPNTEGPIRYQQINRDRWDCYGLDVTRSTHLKEALQQTLLHRYMKNPATVLRIPDAHSHEKILAGQLRAVLHQGADPAQALQVVAQRWQELDRKRGMKEHLKDYRTSLGLR